MNNSKLLFVKVYLILQMKNLDIILTESFINFLKEDNLLIIHWIFESVFLIGFLKSKNRDI
jgi:hypothetical protein